MTDLISKYVRFTLEKYEKDPSPQGWITKNPPSIADGVSQIGEELL